MKAPTLEERQAEAYERINRATRLLADHSQAAPGWCSCGKRWVCSVIEACSEAVAAAAEELEQLQQFPDAPTELLPVIKAAPESASVPRRRRRLPAPRQRTVQTR